MIDWETVHRRLAQLETALDRGGRRSPRDMRAVLHARARVLARPIEFRSDDGDRIEFLEFAVAGERYGIETTHVRDVAVLTGLTRVPGAPAFVGGIATVRGQILSVLDLARLFELPPAAGAAAGRLVVLEAPDLPVGILATAIVGVRGVPRAEIEAALPTLAGGRASYLRGVDRTGTALLDAPALLAARDLVVGVEAEA